MQNEQRLQKKIAELQAQWDEFGKLLAAFNRERILETKVEERIRLDDKIAATTAERERLEQQLRDLETQLAQLQAESEKREEQRTPPQPFSAPFEPERPKIIEQRELERRQKDIITESPKQGLSQQTEILRLIEAKFWLLKQIASQLGWKFWLLWIVASIVGIGLGIFSVVFLARNRIIDSPNLFMGILALIMATSQWLIIHQYISSFQTLWWVGANVIVLGFAGEYVARTARTLITVLMLLFVPIVLGPLIVGKFRKPIPGKK